MTEIINRSAVLRPAWHHRVLADSRSGATKTAKAVYICSTHWSIVCPPAQAIPQA